MVGWLVGWLVGSLVKAKRGVCVSKKVNCGPLMVDINIGNKLVSEKT